MNKVPLIIVLALVGLADNATARELTLDDVFPTDRVLDVRITVAEEDWDAIRIQRRDPRKEFAASRKLEPVEGPYSYVSAQSFSIDGVEFGEVAIRKKGFMGSQSEDRPSLKVKLNHVDASAQIEGLSTLTFNNNRQDHSLQSQIMSYAFFNRLGSPAPRCAYAKVTVNGKNLGVYCHVETAREPMLKRGFGNDQGTLFEGTVVDFFEGWEGSFERKVGDDTRGRAKLKQLIQALQAPPGNIIVSSNAEGRAWVPTSKEYDREWMDLDFDDSTWVAGKNGAGFERGEGYESLISPEFDFADELQGRASSIYMRLPFEIDNLDNLASDDNLLLKVKYDDGFVAYLNGHKVAAMNAPEDHAWNSLATASHDDRAAVQFELINISQHHDKLRNGANVLAIHGLNVSENSTDMVLVAELETSHYDYEQAISEVVDLDAFYKFWAIESLLGWWDGYTANRNNFFVYLNPETDKLYFLPWGADALFEKGSRLRVDERMPISVKTQGLVAHRLYQLPASRQRFAGVMRELLEKHWNEDALLAEVDRHVALVKPHLSGNQHLRLGGFKEFIRTRRRDILEEIEDGMPIWTSVPSEPYIRK